MSLRQILEPSQPDYLGYLYAIAVAGGGVAGYVKTGSVPSMAAGLVFGSLLGLGSYLVTKDRNNVLVSTLASGILTGVMGSRYYKTGNLMPAGVVAGLSFLMLLRYGQVYFKR